MIFSQHSVRQTPTKAVILFGAGASAFSGPCAPNCPPIGDRLFERLLHEGGAAARLSEDLKRIFLDEGFEAGMLQLSGARYYIASEIQRQLAVHLAGYRVEPGNYFLELVRHLGPRMRHLCFATLNYDLLLEQALGTYGVPVEYDAKRPAESAVSVIKLHGSCNFLPTLGSTRVNGLDFFGVLSLYDDLPMYAASNQREIIEWCNDPANETLHPIVAEYVHDKNVYINPAFIASLHEHYSSVIIEARLIVLIGVRYSSSDTHIWNPIAKSSARLAIVNPSPEDILSWARANRAADSFALARDFSNIASILAAVDSVLLY